ncbi:Crp/Fnr family transcriptional regulator [Bosea sp. BH3]|uniref:Crp/Fnr family transcriptional regulator n=1 Tax=Bosea sp. BH3 TaxID=2871701 RepID=UPI0021CB4A9C|nr:cyclic nucleotide-binding domain-containing protein [Bosea sp. BH3]MCU4178287.1 cyclic nucleotide-binding domain-containing protein [Bosea sp. BH3]
MTLETDLVCLKSLPLFQGMPAPRLKLVALMGERLHFEPGETIISESDGSEGVFVILSGDVEFSRQRGSELLRFQKESGSIIGDVSLLSGHRFLGDVKAKSPVSALRIPKDLFFELLHTVPEFGLAVCRDLAGRLYRLVSTVLHEEEAFS